MSILWNKKSFIISLFSVVTLLSAACQWVKPIEENQKAPTRVDDLSCEAQSVSELRCSWHAVKDGDGHSAAKAYELRYADAALNSANFAEATLVENLSAPKAFGEAEEFVVNGLAEDRVYHLALVVIGQNGLPSELSDDVTGKTQDHTAPAPVTGFSISDPQTGNVLDLSWTNPSDEDFVGTQIWRKKGSSPNDVGDGTLVCTTHGTETACASATTHQDTGLDDGTEYFYAAFAFDDEINPNFANAALASASPSDTTAPLQLSTFDVQVSATAYALDLQWTQPAGQHADYVGLRILRFETAPSPGDIDPANPPASATLALDDDTSSRLAFTDQGLIEGQSYWYLAYPKDEVPNYGLPMLGTATVQAGSSVDTTPPATITLLPVANSDGTVLLSWLAPGDDESTGGAASTYALRYTDNGDYSNAVVFAGQWENLSDWSELPTPATPGTPQSVTVSGLNPDTMYYFGLKAADEVGNWSVLGSDSIASIKTADHTPPAPVTGFNISDPQTGNVLNLTWSAPSFEPDFAGVELWRREGLAPSSPGEGILVCKTNGTPACAANGFVDSGLEDGVEYFYSIFTYDDEDTPNYSAPMSGSGMASDQVPPLTLQTFTATDQGTSVSLQWTLPTVQTDLSQVIILRREDRFPLGPSDTLAHIVVSSSNFSLANYVDQGLIEGQTYYYAAYTQDDTPNFSTPLYADATIPYQGVPPISDLHISNPETGNQLDLSWTNPQTTYTKVFIIRYEGTTCSATNTDPGSNSYFNLEDHVAAGAQTWSDIGIQDNTDYCYAVFAVNISDFSPGTIISGQSTDTLAPASVSAFSATPDAEGNAIQLEWTNPTDDFQQSIIVRKIGSAPQSLNDGTQLVSGSVTTYLDTDLVDGVHYYYAAWAVDEVPNFSDPVYADAIPADGTAPEPLTAFSAAAQADGSVSLSWTAPNSEDYAGVKILRREDQAVTGLDDANADVAYQGADLSYSDTGLVREHIYYYAAFAFDEVPNFSTALNADADLLPPQAVTNFTATPDETVGARAIDLAWTNPGDVDLAGLRVLRKQGSYPTSESDAAAIVICQVSASTTSCHDDVDVLDGVEYFYAVFVFDEVPNYLVAAQVTATRSCIDDDGDTFTDCESAAQTDCDDTRADVHPNAEAGDCSARDWNCDGEGWEDAYCVATSPYSADCQEAPTCDPGIGCNWHLKDNFTPCTLNTSNSEVGDLAYDICSEGICISPSTCGDASCNVPGPSFQIPDTNVRACFDNDAEMVCPAMPCNTDGSPDFCGQDAQYGWDTVNASATRFHRDLTTSEQPVVSDYVTGLVWQGCAAGQSGNNCGSGSASTKNWQDALTYCDGLDWGGHDDWRLPDIYALTSLDDLGRHSPSIDLAAFPGTPSSNFWSSSSYDDDSNNAWRVGFYRGNWYFSAKSNSDGHVRCVRSGAIVAISRFVRSEAVAEQSIVHDNITGLIWQGCAAGQSGSDCATGSPSSQNTWQGALAYCEGLDYAGHSDWRLPNMQELASIIDNRKFEPAINELAFPGMPLDPYFWSSSSFASNSNEMWMVDLRVGGVASFGKDFGFFVLCVRSDP